MIVPVADASPSVALTGLDSVTLNVSSGSSSVSPFTPTSTVFDVSPAGIVTVVLAAA